MLRSCAALALCLAAASCGDDDRPGGNADPIPIQGGERLGWTQPADSVQSLREHTFKLYVDGRPSTLSATRCNEGRPRGSLAYECSGGLPRMNPGRHVLELTSVWRGIESPLSAPLVVTVSPAGQTLSSAPQVSERDSTSDAPPVSSICVDGAAAGECYDLRAVAGDLRPVTALASTPDGDLLLTEGASRLRVLVDGSLMPEPALTLSNPGSRIVGLAVDAQFIESRLVFVAWTEPAATGQVVNVTRYRKVGDVLGEGATILTGIPIADDTLAPLAVDEAGLMYVALPEGAVAGSGQATPFGGAVMRVDRDGRALTDSAQSSPLVAQGYARPTFLGIDPTSKRIWLAGRSDRSSSLSHVDIPPGADQPGLHPLTPADLFLFANAAAGSTSPALAFGEGGRVLAMLGNQLFLASSRAGGRLNIDGTLSLPSYGVPLAVANAPGGSWYVAALTGPDTSAIVLLEARR